MATDNPWKTKSTTVPYENPWIRIEHSEVVNPAGKDGIYGVVRYKNYAVGVVPLDEEGHVYLVGQYRYALDRFCWEIPEGGCPVDTDPLETARRELKEETGLEATDWQQIMEFHLSNSVSDEWGVAFLARGLTQGQSDPEDTEDIRTRRLPLSEAVAMTMDGRITDAITMLALQRVHLLQQQGKL
jgi:8-oxo-dGTP pyrophosphatase MutT (NUDIX family)